MVFIVESGQVKVDDMVACGDNLATTPPLQVHLVGYCLGRENRLLGGFFIFQAVLWSFLAKAARFPLKPFLAKMTLSRYNSLNTTATLSAFLVSSRVTRNLGGFFMPGGSR